MYSRFDVAIGWLGRRVSGSRCHNCSISLFGCVAAAALSQDSGRAHVPLILAKRMRFSGSRDRLLRQICQHLMRHCIPWGQTYAGGFAHKQTTSLNLPLLLVVDRPAVMHWQSIVWCVPRRIMRPNERPLVS